MNMRLHNQGLSLIEVLVASSVFMVGLMAMLTSTITLVKSTKFSKNYLIASNLAKEGLEVVKNKVDQNRLDDIDFDDGLDSTGFTNNGAVLKFESLIWSSFDGEFSLVKAIVATDGSGIADCTNCRLNLFSNGLYGNAPGGSVPPGDTPTPVNFYRLISFKSINCDKENIPASLSICATDTKIGIKVTSTVMWYKGAEPQQVEISNKFFDWQ